MYVIATVICPNVHCSVSLHVPFLNLLFELDSYSNEYLLANFGFDDDDDDKILASIQPRTSPNKFVSSSSREFEFAL